MARRPRWFASLATACLVLAFSSGPALAVNPNYAGWQTQAVHWHGIDGYLRQSTTVSTSGLHAIWITICGDCFTHWVQTGTYQGVFQGGSSQAAVHVYYENVDACGDYYAGDKGVPPAPDYAYYLMWDGASSHNIVCQNGDHQAAYTFEYRKGSVGNTPFHYGTLPTSDGMALAKTEIQGAPPINTDYFGCDPNRACGNGSYGLHLFNGTSWLGWTGASTKSEFQPPWLHTYNNYWSFKTCPASC